MQQLKVIHSSRLMKKIFSLLCFVILSLAVGAQGYSIKISLENSKDTIAYLGHHFGNQRYLNDTTSVIAGTAIFEGEEDLPEGLYFYYSPNAYFEFVVSDQQFEIQTKSPTFVEDFVSIGSEENEIFHQLQTVTLKNQRIIQGLQTRYEEVKEDSTAAKKVRKEIEIASEKFSAERKEVADAHPESFVGRFIRALSPPSWADFHPELEPKERYREYKAHYLDGIDITDEALLRSPAYHPLINEYMDKVTIQNPDSIISSADFILDSVIDNPTMFRYALVTITQKYETSEVMGMDKVFVHLADKYHLHDIHGLTVSDPHTLNVARLNVQAIQEGVNLGAAAMHNHRIDTDLFEQDNIKSKLLLQVVINHGVATVFNDNSLAAKLLHVGQGVNEDLCFFNTLLNSFCHINTFDQRIDPSSLL